MSPVCSVTYLPGLYLRVERTLLSAAFDLDLDFVPDLDLEGHGFSRCGEHKEFFSNLFSRCGKTQTSQRTKKIVMLF